MVFAKSLNLDSSDDYTKKEFDVWFWGSERELDEVILEYLDLNGKKRFGSTYAELENYFVYKKELCSARILCKHLENLQKWKIIRFELCRGLKFYKKTRA